MLFRLVATTAVLLSAGGGASAEPGGARCSASSLPPARAKPDLPRAVESMRQRIVAAARKCDYAALVRLGNERGRGFAFSYGGTMSAPTFWRTLERRGSSPRPMAALVRLLSMPHATVAFNGHSVPPSRARLYVWPRAHRANATARDWAELRTLYTPTQLERMRRGGTGYLGYRVGITPSGDWQFFIAGD
jgi:hypothetical protein